MEKENKAQWQTTAKKRVGRGGSKSFGGKPGGSRRRAAMVLVDETEQTNPNQDLEDEEEARKYDAKVRPTASKVPACCRRPHLYWALSCAGRVCPTDCKSTFLHIPSTTYNSIQCVPEAQISLPSTASWTLDNALLLARWSSC